MFRLALLAAVVFAPVAGAADRPNVVWLVAEDLSPTLGCYGHPDARTPNLDRFAAAGLRFTRAFTHAPVCAPSRSGLITGQYPTTLGTHHMRSKLVKPPAPFTDSLKRAGYAVFWPGKTDFNFDPPAGWADKRDWLKDPSVLPANKPFFAFANFAVSHESRARAPKPQRARDTVRLTPADRHDPATVKLPPYYPDVPEVRDIVAAHHDTVTAMDYQIGDALAVLDKAGLAKNTVVVFIGDHGWGLPRGKRWPYDSGTRVPMIVRWPGVLAPGVRDDLVQLLDLAPTTLAIAGAAVPKEYAGRVIVGDTTGPAPAFVVSCRDRMDECPDRVRSVRGERFRYVKNFEPARPYFAWLNYQDENPLMQAWRREAFAGKLNPTQKLFMARTKPTEELYDTAADPHEVANLAADPAHAATLGAMRKQLADWVVRTKDLGEAPEAELIRRGLVRDVLTTEYADRVKRHPKTPPVP